MRKFKLAEKEKYVPEKHNPEKHPMLKEQYDLVYDYNGTIISKSAGINPLNNKWTHWNSVSVMMYVSTKGRIKEIVENIRKKSDKIYLDTFKGKI